MIWPIGAQVVISGGHLNRKWLVLHKFLGGYQYTMAFPFGVGNSSGSSGSLTVRVTGGYLNS